MLYGRLQACNLQTRTGSLRDSPYSDGCLTTFQNGRPPRGTWG
jgi:hypothetical protein